ncbi:MAG TPA: hypothetical protein HA275_00930 [Halobacteriales archaeon]|uniref:UPF0146 family protein n=1 Tax=Candidatus Hikarchaeum yamanae TaxID=2675326 RepID=UPI00185C43DF|nr:hypothetical protein [Halobacteriales archaeon]
MHSDSTTSLLSILRPFKRLVEVGIGSRFDVAHSLSENRIIVATDIHQCNPPDGVQFVLDDICDPLLDLYSKADIIYALNLPPELHQPTLNVALQVKSKFLFTTLGNDFPEIPVRIETTPGETIYWALE